MQKYLVFLMVVFYGCTGKDMEFQQDVEVNIQLEETSLGVSVIADSLTIPWEITWGPDDHIWLTEQAGIVSKIDPSNGKKTTLLSIVDSVWMKRTSGLLGMAIHPDQHNYPFVFINYTLERDGKYFSRLQRYTVENDTLTSALTLLEIPAGTGHNGSRLVISERENVLFWATGDIARTGNAQDPTNLNGKILRIGFDGEIPEDNPDPNTYVWAWGFRNIQGLVLAANGNLYASEHGDAIEDEVNLLRPMRNYGWHTIEGFHDLDFEKEYAAAHQTVEPLMSWTPTIAPAGLDYYSSKTIPEWDNSLIMVTLKGQGFRVLKLDTEGKRIIDEKIFLEKEYGRIRDLCISPAGDVYISTSNHDWNPMTEPDAQDDRILRIHKVDTLGSIVLAAKTDADELAEHSTGEVLYQKYCLACHKGNGKGVAEIFPALAGSAVVNNTEELIPLVLNGYQGEVGMPSFAFMETSELAKILTYVRSQWGNESSSISAEEIEKYR